MIFRDKISDYTALVKLRLSLLVVFSASMSYLWASNRHVDTLTIWLLSIGGFFITSSSNIFNQVWERKSDALMKRTASRPLPGGRMKINQAVVPGLILGISGLYILSFINLLAAALGALAMLIYIFIYTPLKKVTWLTVIPGALAGSLPVVIGGVAANGTITLQITVLFLIQFLWQFPHTWSIAWLLNDEYEKAGFRMLPSNKKDKTVAALIMFSTFLMIPAGFLLYMYASTAQQTMWLLVLAGILMFAYSFRLYHRPSDKYALRLMFSCFLYLPVIFIILVAEKFLG